MFYVLDFHSHRFTTCETVEKVNAATAERGKEK